MSDVRSVMRRTSDVKCDLKTFGTKTCTSPRTDAANDPRGSQTRFADRDGKGVGGHILVARLSTCQDEVGTTMPAWGQS